MIQIENCNAVVTGGGSGIGRSISLALAAAGANVVVADIDRSAAQSVAREVSALNVLGVAHKVDVSSVNEMQILADYAYGTMGSIEILVNNAGVTLRPFRASWDTSLLDFQWLMSINFWGVLHSHHVFVPRMLKSRGRKHIVNTSSIGSLLPVAGHAAYCATKSAVDGFSYCVREELRKFNIGVSLLHPGPIRTAITESEKWRPKHDRSTSRTVKPWAEYVDAVSNPIVDRSPGEDVDLSDSDPDSTDDPLTYITPKKVGSLVVRGILENKPNILTHPPLTEQIMARAKGVIAGRPE